MAIRGDGDWARAGRSVEPSRHTKATVHTAHFMIQAFANIRVLVVVVGNPSRIS